jgi:protein-disulfide isomerase
MCFLTYLATIGFLGCALPMVGGEKEKDFLSKIKKLFSAGKDSAGTRPPAALLSLAAIASLLFIAVIALIPSFIRVNSSIYSMVDNALVQFYEKWRDQPQKTIELQDGDGVLGAPTSKVKIIEFSDFECPFCQRTAFTLHTALRPLENRIHFAYKYFPLDSACNPAVIYQLHPQACSLARLGYCAQKKGKFWEYHDLVFLKLSEDQLKQGIDAITPSLQPIFTKEEVTQCLSDAASLKAVADDIKQGNGLGIKGTPTLFINGKQVPNQIPITVETLNKLVSIDFLVGAEWLLFLSLACSLPLA